MEYIKKPMEIEKKSFEIITEELGEKVKKFSASSYISDGLSCTNRPSEPFGRKPFKSLL